MKYLYGTFDDTQFEDFKKKLHNKMFWLLLYQDPKTKDSFGKVDFTQYFTSLMKEIDALNELLSYPESIVEICCKLQAAYSETCKDEFDYLTYRKLVLDAHALVDKINGGDAS